MAKKTPKATKSERAPGKSVSVKSENGLPAVRVRMYRQGLGDCFLITFDVGKDEKHMLIDFGTLGTEATSVTMTQVAQSIAQTSDPKNKRGVLEVLVATHAHKDHVSGFLSQKQALKDFNVKNVWMGWTEDPTDQLAKILGNTAQALRAAIAGAYAGLHASDDLTKELEGIAEFEDGAVNGQLAMGETIAQALDIVRKFPGAKTTYYSPGPPALELPEIPGFRFYVLGPPRDPDKLATMGEQGSDELYGLARAFNARLDGFETAKDDDSPFDARFCYPASHADQFFADYARMDQKYRRIDGNWLQAAAELAMKLDNFRNNTSLALAIERKGDGRVLLFPADAQQGNWLSWHDPGMEWKVQDSTGAPHTVNAADLLSRVVFYKVGHHSSHNATAKGKGLEIMRNNPELTAFIPVDRAVALKKSPPGSWRMPAVALYRELLEACDGRVVRADLGWADEARAGASPASEKELVGLATAEQWAGWRAAQSKTTNVDIQPLYIDYHLT